MNKTNTYNKPPIIESLIELKFKSASKQARINKIGDKLKHYYFKQDPIKQSTIEFKVDNGAFAGQGISEELHGIRLQSVDAVDFATVINNVFGVSRLAPYVDFDNLVDRLLRDYEVVKSHVENVLIDRIGVRTINRIDIPVIKGENGFQFTIAEYFNVSMHPPEKILKSLNSIGFTLNFVTKDPECNCTVIINRVDSPLINNISFMLDIDLGITGNISSKAESLKETIISVRSLKNEIFESFITDKTRELFK